MRASKAFVKYSFSIKKCYGLQSEGVSPSVPTKLINVPHIVMRNWIRLPFVENAQDTIQEWEAAVVFGLSTQRPKAGCRYSARLRKPPSNEAKTASSRKDGSRFSTRQTRQRASGKCSDATNESSWSISQVRYFNNRSAENQWQG